MPTISVEVTDNQYDSYERGFPITVEKPKPKTYIITFLGTGNAFEVTTKQEFSDGYHDDLSVIGQCKLIRKGTYGGPVGTVRNSVGVIDDDGAVVARLER